ncbi:MAG: response regulator [Lachnospiraceae bacterium]|nr:response regulator [Lachnospiraceae bacterium]MBD5482436.1 response regulator [Lachnospiraceae bacterium]
MGRIRILAVDDSAINLAAIEQALKEEYEVIAVNSGNRALQYLKSETPDLILLDIQMTSMDGLETLKEIRAMRGGGSIPVIMLTAKNDKATFLESTKLGIYDYIVKPFQSEYLHERILRTLKRAGVIALTSIELKAELKKLQRDIENDNRKGALLRADEMVNYKVDAMVRQTILKVRERIDAGDANGALSCLNGIL